MRPYEDPESPDYNPDVVEADRALGQRAAEIVLERQFSEFRERVHVGVGLHEPHLVYRDGDTFLVVDTEIDDGTPEEDRIWTRTASDGQLAERGSLAYLLAGLGDMAQRTEEGATLVDELRSALPQKRVRYVMVTVVVEEEEGKQGVESVEVSEYELLDR